MPALREETVSFRSSITAARVSASALIRRPPFRQGVIDTLPMAIGIGAWGIVAGVAMSRGEMGVPLAVFMSVVVYAGSAQIAVLPLIAADAPIWVVWAATLCVSLRFVAFSFHYRPYFAHLPRGRRIAISYLMGDTNFAIFIRRFPMPEPAKRRDYADYFLGSALITFGIWQISITTGIVGGHAIPTSWGIGFAGTMALLALTCNLLRDTSTAMAAVVAACAAVAAYALPLRLNIVVAIAAAVAMGALARHLRPRGKRDMP